MTMQWQRFSNPGYRTNQSDEELDAFEQQYFETALWSTTGLDDKPLDDCFDVDDLREKMPEWFAEQRRDIADFRESNEALLEQAGDDSQNGHDFWLTRERHGAGFWDRGYGKVGDKLSEAAHVYGGAGDAISVELVCEES